MADFERLECTFLRDDAGSPLGPGMPPGAPLRTDGQSHYQAWQAILRRDPCSYCGILVALDGTVDHVDPRAHPPRGLGTVHGWSNVVGACGRCNHAKRDLPLLVFLYRRRWSPPHPEPTPGYRKPDRYAPAGHRSVRSTPSLDTFTGVCMAAATGGGE